MNRFKLNVQANAVCVDILVWATVDEGGEFVYYSRLNSSLFLPSFSFKLPTMSHTTPFSTRPIQYFTRTQPASLPRPHDTISVHICVGVSSHPMSTAEAMDVHQDIAFISSFMVSQLHIRKLSEKHLSVPGSGNFLAMGILRLLLSVSSSCSLTHSLKYLLSLSLGFYPDPGS